MLLLHSVQKDRNKASRHIPCQTPTHLAQGGPRCGGHLGVRVRQHLAQAGHHHGQAGAELLGGAVCHGSQQLQHSSSYRFTVSEARRQRPAIIPQSLCKHQLPAPRLRRPQEIPCLLHSPGCCPAWCARPCPPRRSAAPAAPASHPGLQGSSAGRQVSRRRGSVHSTFRAALVPPQILLGAHPAPCPLPTAHCPPPTPT